MQNLKIDQNTFWANIILTGAVLPPGQIGRKRACRFGGRLFFVYLPVSGCL